MMDVQAANTVLPLGGVGQSGHDGRAGGHHLKVLVGPLEEAMLGDGQLGGNLGLLDVGEGGRADEPVVQVDDQLGSGEACITV